jgi:hypothetical protein
MTSKPNAETAIKVLAFDGTDEFLYPEWATKTTSMAEERGFDKAIHEDRALPTKAELASSGVTEEQKLIHA